MGMSVFSELNQANNRNGDLLTEISRLQAENAKLRAQSDAEPDSKLEELVSRWEALKDGGGPSASQDVLQEELLTIISLARKGLTAPPRLDTSAGLIEAARQTAFHEAAEIADSFGDRHEEYEVGDAIRARAADRSGK
jgi:hypothetical protein